MMRAVVRGVAVRGPGLDGWRSSQAILGGRQAWLHAPVSLPPPAILPTTERRRSGLVTRLALDAASEAAAASQLDPASLRVVFASSNGDGPTVGAVLDAIAAPDGFVSPTQFHNSVHNAAAGYWSIAAGSSQPVTCLGCFDATFGSSLMKALAESAVERAAVLLIVYDAPFPTPLAAVRDVGEAFAVGLVLAPDGPGAVLEAEWRGEPAEATRPRTAGLGALAANPAAQSLPLLEHLARGEAGRMSAPLPDGHLAVWVAP